jgi:anti-anti-sigma factor
MVRLVFQRTVRTILIFSLFVCKDCRIYDNLKTGLWLYRHDDLKKTQTVFIDNNNLFEFFGINIHYQGWGNAMVLEICQGVTIITLPRRFDFDSAPSIENELKPVLEKHPERVIFDFSKTEYISSAGVRVLLKSTRSLKEGGGKVAFSTLCH